MAAADRPARWPLSSCALTDFATDLAEDAAVDAEPVAPSKATVWRVVTEIDPVAADAMIGAWPLERAGQNSPSDAAGTHGGSDEIAIGTAVGIAVDGNTLRGAKDDPAGVPASVARAS